MKPLSSEIGAFSTLFARMLQHGVETATAVTQAAAATAHGASTPRSFHCCPLHRVSCSELSVRRPSTDQFCLRLGGVRGPVANDIRLESIEKPAPATLQKPACAVGGEQCWRDG